MGRDELENDAEEDGVGRDARGQPAIRGEKERGGGLVGANGNSAGENAGRRPHRRRSRGAAPGTKGIYIYIFLSLIFLPPFSKPCLLSILTRRVAGNRPLLLEDRPLCLFFVPRRWTEDGLIAAIRVD